MNITPNLNTGQTTKGNGTISQLYNNMTTDFEKLPEGFVIGNFQFEKSGYKDASINEDIITKLNELIQPSENKDLDEKATNTSIVASTIRKLINGEKATSESKTPLEHAVNDILSLDKYQHVHGGQSLNRLDLQNILNLLLIEGHYTTSNEGEGINPRLRGSLSELIKKIALLDRYGYDSADDVVNDNGDIKAKIKDIKSTALGNIRQATIVSEEIALAKKNKSK